MNYELPNLAGTDSKKASPLKALRAFFPLLAGENKNLIIAIVATIFNSGINLAGPVIIGFAIDHFVQSGNYRGVLFSAGLLILLYAMAFVLGTIQTRVMGAVAQRLLFTLRNTIFRKLQTLPVAFFNQNKAGDLISRINNDTDKLNQFFSQSLMQFVSNILFIFGAAGFLLTINLPLGAATLAPAIFLLIFTQVLSAWIRRQNAKSLQATGGLSAEIQESLDNFKVIVAFNRRDYFREKFQQANDLNFKTSVSAGIANTVFMPVYGFCANVAQLIVLSYGITLIASGHLTVGILISYFTYATRFYDPLRQIAALWASFQLALASWDRITAILSLESDMTFLSSTETRVGNVLMEFRDVHFSYPNGKEVLHGISFALERGKTYALVGPTGGGKTTTASLMARLYDPTKGQILLDGKDIRSWKDGERTQKIGFILQEPFLFTGTVRDNILYGNETLGSKTNEEITAIIEDAGLGTLLTRFESGLETKVLSASDSISLGQKQIIAFMRAVLRRPEILILDEATANIDTVTEQMLEAILRKLPSTTTRVIIAHRLNTIENADDIFFVNAGSIVRAGSLDHALDMLMHGKRES